MNRNTALVIAGICGTAFIGYCIYFDKKRRSDPDFKKKLRESKCGAYSCAPYFELIKSNCTFVCCRAYIFCQRMDCIA